MDQPSPQSGARGRDDDGASRPEGRAQNGSRLRRSMVVLLAVVTALSTFISSVAVWSHDVLLDTDSWVRTVGPLADDPDVTRAVATYLVDQAATAIDLEAITADALPDRAGFLAAPLAGSIRTYLTDQAAQLMRTEQFRRLWVQANRVAHREAVRLLRGEAGAVTADDGSVTLNLVPAIALLLQRFEGLGFVPRSFRAPKADWNAPASESIDALAAAIGHDLPPTFGQVQVFDSRTLAQAQDAVSLFDRVVWLLVALTLALGAMCLGLSTERRRTVVILSLGIASALILSSAVVNATGDYVLGLITDEVDRSAAAEVVRRILSSLQEIKQLIALVGLAIAVVAFLAGDGPIARRLRGAGRRTRGSDGAPSPTAAPAPAPATATRDGLRIVGVIATLAVVVIIEPTFGTLAVVAAGAIAYQGAVAVLTRPA